VLSGIEHRLKAVLFFLGNNVFCILKFGEDSQSDAMSILEMGAGAKTIQVLLLPQ
jgi:hypothetical protein